ncbi:MAG: TaqI-like C-terminal specificity domain-containing protein [Candidatus Nanoarchaeia archaeon]
MNSDFYFQLESLTKNFQIDTLVEFFRNKINQFIPLQEEKNVYNDDRFFDCQKIGEIPFSSYKKLVLYSFKTNSELTERSSKKAQYIKGKTIIKEENADAGIFIFYDNSGKFRFSLIIVDYVGTKRQWSNFKRFTYFVNPEETNKTFIQRIGDGDFSNLDSIKEAFSVAKLTKEFYQEIANWYFWALKVVRFPQDAKSEPNGKNIALIRLITRIIFIWFMRQKGIVKKELFEKNFLRDILKDLSDDESTYYKAILQNLFFATLNTPIEQRKFRRGERYQGYLNKDYMNHTYFRHHSLFKDPNRMEELFKDIPFLNGGLFECLDKAKNDESNETGREIRIDGFSDDPKKQPYVPNFLFFSEEREEDLNEDYGTKNKRYKVRGLIPIFMSYNFTIDENTPNDEEVALDPELLGKIFENLLASYNPETATTARKATGSYYTPREIINFMVKESLKEYLSNYLEKQTLDQNSQSNINPEAFDKLFSYDDDTNPFDEETTNKLINAIHNLKLLDPAVGSGAFPMGALHLLVHILHKLDPHNEKWKEEQIKALSSIKDPKVKQEALEKIEEIFRYNELDYGRKLYLIQNCIYGVDIQPIAIQIAKLRFFISLLVDEKLDKTKPNFGIEPLPNLETNFVVADTLIELPKPQQLSLTDPKIQELEKKLKETRNNYFMAKTREEKENLKKKDSDIRKELVEQLKKIGFPNESTEKIARWNPYNTNKAADWFDPEWMFGLKEGFDIVIGNPPYIQLQKDSGRLAKLYEQQNYTTFTRTGDIYTLFYEKGLQLLKSEGYLCYITSNKWMRAGYGEKLRTFFKQYNPLLLLDLGPDIFENTTVDTNILLIQKAQNQNQLKALTLQKSNRINFEEQIKKNSVLLTNLSTNAWFIGNNAEQKLKEKIESIGRPLKNWDVNIFRGILTGLNEAFIITTEKRKEILENCKTEDERNRTEAIIKPILRGRDIHRYFYEWNELWVIVIPAGWTNQHKGKKKANTFIYDQFPSLMNHLKNFEEKAKKRDDKGDYWWELRKCAYYQEFEKEKVIYSEIVRQPQFYFDTEKFYVEATSFLMTGQNTKYLCGLLNSKPITYFFKHWYAGGGLGEDGFRYKKAFLENIPLPPIESRNSNLTKKIESFVDKILSDKKKDKNADTRKWEEEIDQLVYKLYNLSDEEIKIIEEMEPKIDTSS